MLVKLAQWFMAIRPRFLFVLKTNLVAFCTYVTIISKLNGSFFCSAKISCAYLHFDSGKYPNACGSVVESNQIDFDANLDLTDNKDSLCPICCG